ncbi:MAG: hypothetical protein ACLGI8_06870 [Acidimicrobiia bacterium]
MQEGPIGGQDQPRSPEPDEPGPGGTERAPDPLAAEAAELRRLVEAGASSPEELRALAARLREHRQREEARWRAEVKPQLVRQGKGRLRRQPAPPLPPPALPGYGLAGSADVSPGAAAGGTGPVEPGLSGPAAPGPGSSPVPGLPPMPIAAEPPPGSRALWIGLGLLAMVGLAVLAARTTGWVLLLPVIGLLGWAWSQGRDGAP